MTLLFFRQVSFHFQNKRCMIPFKNTTLILNILMDHGHLGNFPGNLGFDLYHNLPGHLKAMVMFLNGRLKRFQGFQFLYSADKKFQKIFSVIS